MQKKPWGLPPGVWDIRNAYPWLWLVGMWPSAIFCWFYGKRLKEQAVRDTVLGTLCITLAELWCADRDGLQGAFLQPIAPLLAKKATPQTARARAATDRRSYAEGP